jgi:hypothetical protein
MLDPGVLQSRGKLCLGVLASLFQALFMKYPMAAHKPSHAPKTNQQTCIKQQLYSQNLAWKSGNRRVKGVLTEPLAFSSYLAFSTARERWG